LAGAETVAVDTSEEKLKLAEDIGSDHTVLAADFEDYVKSSRPDMVFVHAPSQRAVDSALRVVKRGGTVLMGVCGNAAVQFPEEYTILGSVIGTRQEMNEVLRLASHGRVHVDWAAYKLSEAENVLISLKRGEIVGRAILVP
jgi:alcohol dehydrogenase, propanol-preferring